MLGPPMSVSQPHPEGTEPPRGTLSGLLRHSFIYSLVPIIRNGVSLGMNRLYTAWLLTTGFGVKETVDIWMIAGQQLLGQNLLGGMVRFYFDQKNDRDRQAVVSTCTLLITILAWIVCGIGLLFSDSLTPILLGQADDGVSAVDLRTVLQLTLILIPFQLSSLSGLYYLQILKRSDLYSGIQVAKLFVEIGLNFILIGWLEMGVQGFLLSMLTGEISVSLFLTGWMLVKCRFRIDLAIFRPILAYAAPLIPVGLCQAALHQLDRRLLEHFSSAGFDDTGVYGFGYKIGYLVTAMMLGPFLQIWQPWIFGVDDAKERAHLVARVSTYTVLAVGATSLAVIFFGRQGVLILAGADDFRRSFEVIPFLVTGYVFWALYHTTQIPLFIAKRTQRLLVINVMAVIVNVALNLWWIREYGILGAAMATMCSFAVLALLGIAASYSEAHVPFEWKRISATILCVMLGAGLTLIMDYELARVGDWDFFSFVPLKLVTLVILELMLLFSVLYRDERARLHAWVTSKLRR